LKARVYLAARSRQGRLGIVGKGVEPTHGRNEIAWAPLLVEEKLKLNRQLEKNRKEFSVDQAWA
jgi:hypothetical protein